MKLSQKPKIEIIAIGSELLSPFQEDTNSGYIAQRLNDLGMEVSFNTIVGDDRINLLQAVKTAIHRSELIIATGGLGPTQDDITREVFSEALGRKLVFNKDILREIEKRFKQRRLSMPEINKKQAFILEGAKALKNKNGTAPGILLDTEKKTIVLLPGPPHELIPMFEEYIFPLLSKSQTIHIHRKVLKVASLTESKVESLISDLYPQYPECEVSILAYPGQIEIHLKSRSGTGMSQAEKNVFLLEEEIFQKLKENIFSSTGEELEEVVGRLLVDQKKTLAVAESCTGGLLSSRLTNVPGSSNYFLLGVVAYSNQAKTNLLGVPSSLLEKHGAVSPQTARAMALGIRKMSKADYGIGITGIAGPSGGSAQKPVGLVYISLAEGNRAEVTKNIFPGNRNIVKFQSTQKAMDLLRRSLLNLAPQGYSSTNNLEET